VNELDKFNTTMPAGLFNGGEEAAKYRSTVPSRLFREGEETEVTGLTDKETHFRNTTYTGWTNQKTGRNAGSISYY